MTSEPRDFRKEIKDVLSLAGLVFSDMDLEAIDRNADLIASEINKLVQELPALVEMLDQIFTPDGKGAIVED